MLQIPFQCTTMNGNDVPTRSGSRVRSEVLILVAMKHNIVLPPRADRARILFDYFHNTAVSTTTILQPPILTPSPTLPIRIPLTAVHTNSPRPVAIADMRPAPVTLPTPADTPPSLLPLFNINADNNINSATSPSININRYSSSPAAPTCIAPPSNTGMIHQPTASSTTTTNTVTNRQQPPSVVHSSMASSSSTIVRPMIQTVASSPTPATLSPSDITAQILAAVQNTIQSQNSALLQEVQSINQRLNALQDSHDAAVASSLDSATATGNNLPSMDNLYNTYPASTPYQPAATYQPSAPATPYQPTVPATPYQPTVPAAPSQPTVPAASYLPAASYCPTVPAASSRSSVPPAVYYTPVPAPSCQSTNPPATYQPSATAAILVDAITSEYTFTYSDTVTTSASIPQTLTNLPACNPTGPDSDAEFRLPAMKEATLLKIQAGKYIELTELIHRVTLDTREGFEMVMGTDRASGDQSVRVIPSKSKAKFRNFHEWLQAFLTFAQAYLRSFPERVGGVMGYIDRMNMYSARYPIEAWTTYDKKFRQQLASNPKNRWGVEDKPLFDLCLAGQRLPSSAAASAASVSATCYRCGVVGHYATSCPHSSASAALSTPSFSSPPFRAPQRWPAAQQQPTRQPVAAFRRPRPSTFTFESNICRQFRDTGTCTRTRCAYAHTCSLCGGRHHSSTCNPQ